MGKLQPLDLGRTSEALAAHDAMYRGMSAETYQPGDWDIVETLRRAIGEAFAAETADRNNSDVARRIPSCPAEFRWIRERCAEHEGYSVEGGYLVREGRGLRDVHDRLPVVGPVRGQLVLAALIVAE